VRVGEFREGEVEFRGDAYFASPHFLKNRRGMVTSVNLLDLLNILALVPCKGDDLISLAYVLAFFARHSRLPWDSDIQALITVSLPCATVVELQAFFSCMAEIKSRLSRCCFEGLPSLFMDFYEAAASPSGHPFDYKHYIDQFHALSESYYPSALEWF